MASNTTAHYGAFVSTVAFFVACGGLYISNRSYEFGAAKERRELAEKVPAVDIQLRPSGMSSAAITILVFNRGDINITPLDITVAHSFEIGDLYLSSAQQSIDQLKSALNLSPIGTIAPRAVGTLKARVSGVTDGKEESFTPGIEFRFAVRIRFADEQDTIKTFTVVRRILSALAAEPCPPSWTLGPRPAGCTN